MCWIPCVPANYHTWVLWTPNTVSIRSGVHWNDPDSRSCDCWTVWGKKGWSRGVWQTFCSWVAVESSVMWNSSWAAVCCERWKVPAELEDDRSAPGEPNVGTAAQPVGSLGFVLPSGWEGERPRGEPEVLHVCVAVLSKWEEGWGNQLQSRGRGNVENGDTPVFFHPHYDLPREL